MFSFFRKKPKQPEPSPKPNYSQERAFVAQIFGSAYEKTLSNSNVKKLANSLQKNAENQKRRNEEQAALEYEESKKNTERWAKERANEEAAEKAAVNLANQLRKQRAAKRNERLNNLTRKFSYKTRQNLMNNAARQRGPWRAEHPDAPYMSIENFANSPYFQPHSLYTGTNNNASTISYNSPRSMRSNRPYSPFGGGKTRRSKH